MAGFELVSALKTNYIGTVIDAEFRTMEEFGNIVLNLHLRLEDGTEWNESYGVGKGWALSSPTQIVSIAGRTGIVGNSMYGTFISRVASLPGGSEALASLAERGATDATVWIGFTFKFDSETISYGKNIGDRERNFPSEIVSYNAKPSVAESAEALGGVLAALAANSDNEASFFSKAMQVEGVSTNTIIIDSLGEIWKNRSK